MSKRNLLLALKKTIKEFIVDIRDNIFTGDDEYADMVLVEFFFNKLSPEELMEHSIKHVLPHAEMIRKKKQKFFLKEQNNIFAGLSDAKVKKFAKICTTPYSDGGLSEVDKETIWSYFTTILEITEAFKKME